MKQIKRDLIWILLILISGWISGFGFRGVMVRHSESVRSFTCDK